MLESIFPGLPSSVYWLDYLAINRTCALDTLPRAFNLMPARMPQRLDYLRQQDWRRNLYRGLFRRRRSDPALRKVEDTQLKISLRVLEEPDELRPVEKLATTGVGGQSARDRAQAYAHCCDS